MVVEVVEGGGVVGGRVARGDVVVLVEVGDVGRGWLVDDGAGARRVEVPQAARTSISAATGRVAPRRTAVAPFVSLVVRTRRPYDRRRFDG